MNEMAFLIKDIAAKFSDNECAASQQNAIAVLEDRSKDLNGAWALKMIAWDQTM